MDIQALILSLWVLVYLTYGSLFAVIADSYFPPLYCFTTIIPKMDKSEKEKKGERRKIHSE